MTIAAPAPHAPPRRQPNWLKGVVSVVALAVTLATPGLTLAWSNNSFSAADEALLVQLTNQARASAGLGALTVDSTLTSVARWRSQDMIDRGYFSHTIPPGNTKVFDELKRIGYCYVAAGENIGTNNFPDDVATQTIQDGFMGSPGHRANILGTWKVMGIGAYKGADGTHVWTVLFATKCGSSPMATPKPKAPPKPAVTPRPTARPTPAPTPAPTPVPTSLTGVAPFLTSDDQDPAERGGPFGVGQASQAGGEIQAPGASGAPPGQTAAPGPSDAGGTGLRLRVVDPPFAGSLVDTIVGDIAGAYFGR